MRKDVEQLLQAYLEASSKSFDDSSPEDNAETEALWTQITQLRVRDTPVDWDEMNDVADWVVGLQTRKSSAPENLIQKAIEAGTRFLTVPTVENKSSLDALRRQLAFVEREATIRADQFVISSTMPVFERHGLLSEVSA